METGKVYIGGNIHNTEKKSEILNQNIGFPKMVPNMIVSRVQSEQKHQITRH